MENSGEREEKEEKRQEEEIDNSISIHIFSVSATLVGVCLTVIGIFRAITALKNFDTLGDNILALDALIFLVSCILAYISLRTRYKERKRKLERVADIFFVVGLSLMVIVCSLITYTLI